MLSLRGHKKLRPRPDWSPLGVTFRQASLFVFYWSFPHAACKLYPRAPGHVAFKIWITSAIEAVCLILIFQIFEDVHLHKRPHLAKTLEILNYVFAAIFTLEFILKVIGFGLIKYFSSAWNCLDAFIVSVSIYCSLTGCSKSNKRKVKVNAHAFFVNILVHYHGQKSISRNFVRVTFRLSRYGGNRWLLKWFRAHILGTDRDVKYSRLVVRIKSAGLLYCQNEQWQSNMYEISFWTRPF